MLDSALLYLEDELEDLVRRMLKDASDRNISIIVRFFGFDGTGRKTLGSGRNSLPEGRVGAEHDGPEGRSTFQ
jgi:hypothetical protein